MDVFDHILSSRYIMQNKLKNKQNNKKEDGKFRKKNIKHDPAAESSRAVFGEPKAHEDFDD